MRQAIILPTIYENIFINETETAGLITPLYNPADKMYPPEELEEAKIYYKNMLKGRKEDIQNLYRILLLFDNIILPEATPDYNYDNLLNRGSFTLYRFEDMYEYDPFHQEGHYSYARHLKEAILPIYKKRIQSYFPIGTPVDGFSSFISHLYDSILLRKKLQKKYQPYIEINKKYFDNRNRKYYVRLRREFETVPDAITEKGRFYTDIVNELQILYQTLCWQLKISNDKDAAILNSEFQLADIGCNEYTRDVNQGMEAYSLLRVECGHIIGSLPEANSIQEVLNIKEKRRNDIHNLRQELSRLETEIRNGNSQKAVQQAVYDINRASKALSRNNYIRAVNKWTNLFMVPASIASVYSKCPAITIGAIICYITSFLCTHTDDKNKWLEIMI